ncbi:MAG: RusA family crossover junction endodeoxyribonuclease [Bacteroidales bacterium]|nr:RusA family crossover junction endodeoxyribonuclease [Bacteroidales bacterium]
MVKGHPMFYDSPRLREARALLMAALQEYAPADPIEGPVRLDVLWKFSHGKSHKDGEWRVTRPDTDNLEKLLKDCMSYVGFWKDDAQVCIETIQKKWDNDCGIKIGVKHIDR